MRQTGLVLLISLVSAALSGQQAAVYRATGADSGLFDQYDNDGFSLEVAAGARGAVELRVRVSDSPLASAAPFPPLSRVEPDPPAAPDRDAFARRLAAGSLRQSDAVRRILLGLVSRISYDPDRLRRQDPAAVFASRRAYCVGFAELAVDLLRRAGIPARTVQGILRTDPGADGYEAAIGGAYHRWIEVYYPDRGYVFSDPCSSVNGVDARYIPFSRRALTRPRALSLVQVSLEGQLAYATVAAGSHSVRVRATAP
ncbi:MAG TPA: transglutaminase-like domain-containing protein [Thermoanaerobaculia bacterium]|nr:transglutaminase-like domain-containing protein [Thermoanaerobaculia bacterium]